MDGQQVLKNIKSNDDLNNIPVVMLTSSNLDKDIIESYSSGVNAYVVKPIDFAEFQNAVKNLGIFWALINRTAK
ncbi:MAG: response regulator [Bacteroidales bacterium]|nr:response regulator [Bacteroidales bacterium]MCF8404631.1 response regulator [Bacteroidales bacterium]